MTEKQRASGCSPARSTASAWWVGESSIRVSDIPRHVPRQANGRPVSAATAWRWTLRGLRGVCIRRFKVGGTWCTTLEELTRWQAALTWAAEVIA
jgi:hypothetical protein